MKGYFFSTIGRKQILAVAGIAWALFVLTHMAGNLLIFAGPKAYNMYSHAIVTNPFLIVAELGLVVFLVFHVVTGLWLSFYNKAARPSGYAVASSGAKKTNLVMKTMAHQGVLILIFVVLHLITFKYGTHYEATYDGVTVRDLYRLIVEVFQKPGYVVWYTLLS